MAPQAPRLSDRLHAVASTPGDAADAAAPPQASKVERARIRRLWAQRLIALFYGGLAMWSLLVPPWAAKLPQGRNISLGYSFILDPAPQLSTGQPPPPARSTWTACPRGCSRSAQPAAVTWFCVVRRRPSSSANRLDAV